MEFHTGLPGHEYNYRSLLKIKGIRITHNRIFRYELIDLGVVYPPSPDLYFASSKITVMGNQSLESHHTQLTNKHQNF